MEVLLNGTYKGFIKLGVYKTKKKTNRVVLMLHGLYSESGTPYSKSKLLTKKIIEKNIANVVQFSSSRDWNIFPNDGDYEKQKKAFDGKTFKQETDDIRNTIDLILDQAKYLFGVEKEKIRFLIVANSIGGTEISTLKDKFEYIDKIVLCGSGNLPSSPTKPILSTCPPEKEITDSTATFKGEVLLLQGSKDDVVPLEAQDKLLASYKKAKTRKIIIEGANHSLSKINGKDRHLIYKLYCDFIIKFLQNSPIKDTF